MDTYRAIYDAASNCFKNGNIGDAVESALRRANVGHHIQAAFESIAESFIGNRAPSAIYRPRISIDGNKWCALYGDNLQDGVAGFGDSVATAMQDFNRAWAEKLPSRKSLAGAAP